MVSQLIEHIPNSTGNVQYICFIFTRTVGLGFKMVLRVWGSLWRPGCRILGFKNLGFRIHNLLWTKLCYWTMGQKFCCPRTNFSWVILGLNFWTFKICQYINRRELVIGSHELSNWMLRWVCPQIITNRSLTLNRVTTND